MADEVKQDVVLSTSEKIKAAFADAATNCGSKPRLLAALDITESWMYACIANGSVSLILSLKLQVLTNGKFKWQDLCPTEFQKINAVAEYLVN
jgi:hypothetical protein